MHKTGRPPSARADTYERQDVGPSLANYGPCVTRAQLIQHTPAHRAAKDTTRGGGREREREKQTPARDKSQIFVTVYIRIGRAATFSSDVTAPTAGQLHQSAESYIYREYINFTKEEDG